MIEHTIASALESPASRSSIVSVSRVKPGAVIDMFTPGEIGRADHVMCPAFVVSVERVPGVPATWRIVAREDDTGSTVERAYAGSTGIVLYAPASRCAACIDHPGWAHGDESRRSEPGDVCRACYGSGTVQA